MRLLDLALLALLTRPAALFTCAALLLGCPKKDNEVAPEPAATAAAQAPASDKAGAGAPAVPETKAVPAKKKDDDKGGW